jgi:hypothetical protein
MIERAVWHRQGRAGAGEDRERSEQFRAQDSHNTCASDGRWMICKATYVSEVEDSWL